MSLYLIAETTSSLESVLLYAWAIFQVALGLGFVIFVHELGHFLVAKACGVKCEKFYIGFDVGGRKFWSRQWGETEYGIGVVPLGGYVKMLGQDDNPSNMAQENERSKIKKEDSESDSEIDLKSDTETNDTKLDPRSYMAKSVPQRMAIISAGVIMNLIFGFIFAVVAFRLGVKQTPAIVDDVAPGSPAWIAGLPPGLELTKIGEKTDLSFRDVRMGVALFDKEQGLDVTAIRPGSKSEIQYNLQPKMSEGRLVPAIGIIPPFSLEVGEFPKGSYLSDIKVGLQEGDRITAVDGDPLKTHQELISYLAKNRDSEVILTVQRAAKSDQEEKESAKVQSSSTAATEAKTEEVEVKLPVRPIKRVGLVMTMGPVTAIQKGSPAEKAGIKTGDMLVELNGEAVGDPETLPQRALRAGEADREIKLTLLRDKAAGEAKATNSKEAEQERITKTLSYRAPDSLEQVIAPGDPFVLPGFGLAYTTTNQVASVIPDSPAAKAKIKPGDTITAFKFLLDEDAADKDTKEPTDRAKEWADSPTLELDEQHANWPYFTSMINRAPSGLLVQLSVKSGKETKEVDLALYESEEWHMADRGNLTEPLSRTRTAATWGEAVRLGGRELWYSTTMVYRFLQKIGHQVSFKALGGPITIAQAAGLSAFEGPGNLLIFLTMLSANLAVINFLPIPVLDGGHMVFLAWEGIFRKPMSERIVIAFHMLGFAFIITLMLFVIGLDVFRILGLT